MAFHHIALVAVIAVLQFPSLSRSQTGKDAGDHLKMVLASISSEARLMSSPHEWSEVALDEFARSIAELADARYGGLSESQLVRSHV
jgi:hypothetical protein